MAALPMSVDRIKAEMERQIAKNLELDHQLLVKRERKLELKRRFEQQQKALLQCQMETEQLQACYDAEIKGRDEVVIRTQQNSQMYEAFKNHYESVSAALSQMTSERDSLYDAYASSVQNLSSIAENFRSLQEVAEENKTLQSLINDEERKRRCLKDDFDTKRNQLEKTHRKNTAILNAELFKVQSECNEEEHRLLSIRKECNDLREKEDSICQQYEMETNNLMSQLNSLEEMKEVLKNSLLRASEEEAQSSARITEADATLKKIIEDTLISESNLADLIARRESLTRNLSESLIEKQKISGELLDLQEKNTQISLHKKELRLKFEDSKCKNSNLIRDKKEELAIILSRSAEKKAELEKEIKAVNEQTNAKLLICEDLNQKLSAVTAELESLRESNDTATSLHESLKLQLHNKEDEEHLLSSELDEILKQIHAEEVRVSQLEDSFKDLKEESECQMKAISDKLEEMKKMVPVSRNDLENEEANKNSLELKLLQLKEDKQRIEQSTESTFGQFVRELEDNIAHLQSEKEKESFANEEVINELNSKIIYVNELLSKKEEEILKSGELYNNKHKELENIISELTCLKNTNEENQKIIEEWNKKSEILEEDLLQKGVILNELNLMLHHEVEKTQSKSDEMLRLNEEIKTLEESKAKAIPEHTKQLEELLCDMNKTKQDCESLSSVLSTLWTELDDLKKSHAETLKEVECSETSLRDMDKEILDYNAEIEKNTRELQKLKKESNSLEKKIKQRKEEAATANQVYLKIRRGIEAAKAKKHSQSANIMKQTNISPQLTKTDQYETPTKGKENLASSKTDVDKQVTPRSIMKPIKSPTPKVETKRVSFVEQCQDDMESSSSSIILEDADFEAMAENPEEARRQIVARAMEERVRKLHMND